LKKENQISELKAEKSKFFEEKKKLEVERVSNRLSSERTMLESL